jgi:hypothetical protein
MAENLSGGENTFERTSVRLASAALYGIQECAGELFSDHPFGRPAPAMETPWLVEYRSE